MAQGDEVALGFFYSATLSRVYGLALRITGKRELAQDVTTETYWQAWREAVRFDTQRGVALAWLLMMTRSRALDLIRKQDRAISDPDPELLMNEQASNSTPLSDLLCAEANTHLHLALQQLSAIQRQMIALAFFKDLSHQEMSDVTGLPLGTVKSHLRRAQDTLKTSLSLQQGKPS
jgi:RNA polymerase sigma-70 factor (ECF subfamily)